MNAEAAWLSIICASSIGMISLTSSQLYRREPLITSELMAIVSFLPGFILAAIALGTIPFTLNLGTLVALLVKNVLYGLSFYYRYESLRIFGPFVGALMLGTQPIIIFVLGSALLGEHLTSTQIASIAIASVGLLLLAKKDSATPEQKINPVDFAKYFVLPTLASALAIIWDRQFLRGALSADQFFVFDRLLAIPAFFLALGFVGGNVFRKSHWRVNSMAITGRNWKLLCLIGLLFTVSVYTYNLALEIEKAALVSLVRNTSYPIAALIGAFMFQQQISTRRWVSLSLVILSVVLGAA